MHTYIHTYIHTYTHTHIYIHTGSARLGYRDSTTEMGGISNFMIQPLHAALYVCTYTRIRAYIRVYMLLGVLDPTTEMGGIMPLHAVLYVCTYTHICAYIRVYMCIYIYTRVYVDMCRKGIPQLKWEASAAS